MENIHKKGYKVEKGTWGKVEKNENIEKNERYERSERYEILTWRERIPMHRESARK